MQSDRPDPGADQLDDAVFEGGRHPPDLPLAPLLQHDVQPGGVGGGLAGRRDDRDLSRGGPPALGVRSFVDQNDPAPPRLQGFLAGPADDEHPVLFFVLIAGVGEPIGEVPIVGKENQPLAVSIEPADRKQPRLQRNQAASGRPLVSPVGRVGGQMVRGLVQGDGDALRLVLERLAIDQEVVYRRVGPVSQDGQPAIERDPAIPDDLFTRPAGTQPGARHQLLQPFATRHRTIPPLARATPAANPAQSAAKRRAWCHRAPAGPRFPGGRPVLKAPCSTGCGSPHQS